MYDVVKEYLEGLSTRVSKEEARKVSGFKYGTVIVKNFV